MKKIWEHYSYAIILIISSIAVALCLSVMKDDVVKEEYIRISVSEGDTLWKLSEEYQHSHQMTAAEFIDWVEDANDVNGNVLKAGQTIVIPVKLSESNITELASN